MKQDKTNQAAPINTKAVIFFMVWVFVIVQIGFHATYIQYFPKFVQFTWLHHTHGALMASWVILLVVQPILIHKKKFAAHRFIGKLTYIIVPLLIISILFAAKLNYTSSVSEVSFEEIFAGQSITWLALFNFILFYSLAIFYRKNTAKHMRLMIGTALVMVGPSLDRIIYSYFPITPDNYICYIQLFIKVGLVAVFLASDIIKKKDWMPYSIMLLAFLFSAFVYYARYSATWQAFGRFVLNNFYK
jgi:hypothetical protein